MVAAEFAAIGPLLSLKSYYNAPAAAIVPVLVLMKADHRASVLMSKEQEGHFCHKTQIGALRFSA